MNGLCGGDLRSTIHTKVGERPDQLTLELAEGYTWYDKVRVGAVAHTHTSLPVNRVQLVPPAAAAAAAATPVAVTLPQFAVSKAQGFQFCPSSYARPFRPFTISDINRQNPLQLPSPLELKSVDAGKGWAQLGPTDAPGKSQTVAIVFEDPSIDASDTEIYHRYTLDLAIHGTSFGHPGSIKRRDWTYHTVPPILVFDPPIDPEIVRIFVNVSSWDVLKSLQFGHKRDTIIFDIASGMSQLSLILHVLMQFFLIGTPCVRMLLLSSAGQYLV